MAINPTDEEIMQGLRIQLEQLQSELKLASSVQQSLSNEVERLRQITSAEYLHEVFSRSCDPKKYDGGWSSPFPELDFYIHELTLCLSSENHQQVFKMAGEIKDLKAKMVELQDVDRRLTGVTDALGRYAADNTNLRTEILELRESIRLKDVEIEEARSRSSDSGPLPEVVRLAVISEGGKYTDIVLADDDGDEIPNVEVRCEDVLRSLNKLDELIRKANE